MYLTSLPGSGLALEANQDREEEREEDTTEMRLRIEDIDIVSSPSLFVMEEAATKEK